MPGHLRDINRLRSRTEFRLDCGLGARHVGRTGTSPVLSEQGPAFVDGREYA